MYMKSISIKTKIKSTMKKRSKIMTVLAIAGILICIILVVQSIYMIHQRLANHGWFIFAGMVFFYASYVCATKIGRYN